MGSFGSLRAPCPQRVGLVAPHRALGLQHGGAKVLERTFEEWMRYRDECLRRMASEPYPAGTRLGVGRGAGIWPPGDTGHPQRAAEPGLGVSMGGTQGLGYQGVSEVWGQWDQAWPCHLRLTIGFSPHGAADGRALLQPHVRHVRLLARREPRHRRQRLLPLLPALV